MHNFPHIKPPNDRFSVEVTRVCNRHIFWDSFDSRDIGIPHITNLVVHKTCKLTEYHFIAHKTILSLQLDMENKTNMPIRRTVLKQFHIS